MLMKHTGITRRYPNEYHVFLTMHDRCECRNNHKYPLYGARGVKVCERWSGPEGFRHFLEDMGPRPEGKYPSGIAMYSIDRIDVNGDYCPENCRWATAKEQALNKRNTKRITIGNETKTIDEWSKASGIPAKLIQGRLYDGWDAKKAVFSPLQKKKHTELNKKAIEHGLSPINVQRRVQEYGWSEEDALSKPLLKFRSPEDEAFQVEYNGKKQSIKKWSEEIGIPYLTLKNRIMNLGWSAEEALTTPNWGKQPKYTYEGETLSLGAIAKKYGVPYRILWQRIHREGWTMEKALSYPISRSRKNCDSSP